jgi:hypothetical protein
MPQDELDLPVPASMMRPSFISAAIVMFRPEPVPGTRPGWRGRFRYVKCGERTGRGGRPDSRPVHDIGDELPHLMQPGDRLLQYRQIGFYGIAQHPVLHDFQIRFHAFKGDFRSCPRTVNTSIDVIPSSRG